MGRPRTTWPATIAVHGRISPRWRKPIRDQAARRESSPRRPFTYNAATETFTCPAGHTLKRRHYHKKRDHYEYIASIRVCSRCELRDRCTRAQNARTLKRKARQDDLDTMLRHANSRQATKDIRYRQHLSERSFAQSCRFGYKRARWRRLCKVHIQDFLIATIQNIHIFLTHTKDAIMNQASATVRHSSRAYYSYRETRTRFLRHARTCDTVISFFRRSLVTISLSSTMYSSVAN